MKSWVRRWKSAAIGALVLAVATPTVHAVVRPPEAKKGSASEASGPARMYDARLNDAATVSKVLAARPASEASRPAVERQYQEIASAVAAARVANPSLTIELSPETRLPRILRNAAGALTEAAPGRSGAEITRDYIERNRALFGLSQADLGDLAVLGDSPGGSSGMRMVRIEQRVDGIPVFQSESRFLMDRDGRLTKALPMFVPAAREAARAGRTGRVMTAGEAVSALVGSVGHTARAENFKVTQAAESSEAWVRLGGADDFVKGESSARRVWFSIAPGVLVPAWSLVVSTTGAADFYAVVDADTGAVLWRKNIRNSVSAHDARFRVFVQADGTTPADSPAPQSPNTVAPGSGTQFPFLPLTIVSMHTAMAATGLTGSGNGWIDDCPGGVCSANETQTLGNNVLACLDRAGTADVCDTDANSVLDGNGRPTGNPDANTRNRDFLGTAPRDFQTNFTPPPQTTAADGEVGQTATGTGAALNVFRRGSVTQQFYAANWYHDRLFNLGFDEASANFQQSNLLGLGGVGGDRVLIDVQDQSGTNNANFSTPPDGASGRAQMFRFTFPTIDRDGGLDTEILFHELTHGTSNRLVGNGAGLNWDPAAGMGEGWSDFYALALLNNTNADDPNGQYGAGAYATFKFISAAFLDNYLYAIRRFPYETDNTVNPLTWDDVDEVTAASTGGIPQSPIDGGTAGAMEVHAVGEVWAISLWEVRSRIIAAAAGNVPVGNQTTLELVTDGLKATPVDPTFVEARDAILDADCTTNACANEDHIWGGFADRGLGYGARTPYYLSFAAVSSHMGIRTSTALPNLDTLTIAVDDNVFGNNINGVIDPGETVNLNVTLRNPWRNPVRAVASATGTLTSPSAAVSMLDGVGAWGPIAQQASTAASDVFQIRVAQSAACGSALDFSLTVNSTLGAVIRTFRIRVGLPSGTDAPVTYTQTHNPVLAIPDADLRGVKSTIVVPDDFEIADLNFQVNSITHPWSGDVLVALRSPAATGIDMIADVGLLPGGTFPGNFDGNSGDNFVNVLIDDDIASNAGNDIVQTTSAAAPFTGDWLPPYNSPWTALPSAFGLPPDPVGNLSVMDGESTLGTWTAVVADQAAPDTGTLGGWSLIVTPRHFTCTTVPVELLSIDVE